ncbi:MAG: hypothetical protein WD334_09235, partial [Chitinophagales bacterium]
MKLPFRVKAPGKISVVPSSEKGLGTFGGVFTPSILTILGVIMYLRFGWVVGNVGLIGTLIIVTLSTAITFLTTLSISAIATDQHVRTGGAYYMISRSLGIESGGAIGVPLYLAQALSVALYVVGFAESLIAFFPNMNEKLIGIITTLLITGLALVSAKAVIKIQYFIMFGIVLSLLSLLFGSPLEDTSIEMWGAADRHSESFWKVFAVFFPAVTGIMAGVNMSGDLKNPGKSIPRGTFAAIGVGYVIYMTLPILLANRADALTLIEDPFIMRRISYWGDALFVGVWGATLSSALGSILGAPRVLQALARDGVLSKKMAFLGKGKGEEDTPRTGTIVTMGLVLVAVYLGDLNLIAPVLTMFFLTTYGVLNITAGTEKLLGSPSFRPRFKVHWIFSLLGAIGCFAVMFLINAVATLVAFVFIALIFIWLQQREMTTAWGGVRNGIWLAVIRAGLMRLDRENSFKNWRPHPLVLSGVPTSRWHLIELANLLIHNRGIMTVAMVLTREGISKQRQYAMENNVRSFLNKRGVQALVRAFPSKDPFTGARLLLKAYGLGELVPNTVIMGDNQNPEKLPDFCQLIVDCHENQRNVLVFSGKSQENYFGKRKKIDVWWGGLKGNGGLMIILAYLLKSNNDWWNAELTVKMVVPNDAAAEGAEKNLSEIIREMRTGARAEVIISDGTPFNDILHKSSEDSDLIFLGLKEPEADEDYSKYYSAVQKRVADMPSTILVLASEDVAFGRVLVEPSN